MTIPTLPILSPVIFRLRLTQIPSNASQIPSNAPIYSNALHARMFARRVRQWLVGVNLRRRQPTQTQRQTQMWAAERGRSRRARCLWLAMWMALCGSSTCVRCGKCTRCAHTLLPCSPSFSSPVVFTLGAPTIGSLLFVLILTS